MLDLRRSTGPVLTIAPDSWMRPLLVEDVGSDYIDALNNETVSKFLVSAKSGRYTVENVRAMVRENFESADSMLFGIFCDSTHCGNVRLHDIAGRRAYLGIAIFDLKRQARGLGVKAINAVTDYAIVELGIDTILAGIDDRNIPSVRAFTKAGFKEVDASRQDSGQLWKFERITRASAS
jgi:RimJ/RimL family protein N-acetyltransferase